MPVSKMRLKPEREQKDRSKRTKPVQGEPHFHLLFAHDAQLGQPLQVLRLGGLFRKLLRTRPSPRAQGGLLLRPCHTNTGHGVTFPSALIFVRFSTDRGRRKKATGSVALRAPERERRSRRLPRSRDGGAAMRAESGR